ncbi:MAG: metalloregulator ArsR/SmtB family transcription factor [Actinomycetota bacterium]
MERKPTFECAASREVNELSETLKVISDPNRLRILCALFSGEKCVCEIEEGLAISQPLASHHLGVLREAGLVEVRREGTWSYYSLDGDAVRGLNRAFRDVLGDDRLSMKTEAKSAYCCAK